MMLTEKEAHKLMKKWSVLKKKLQKTDDPQIIKEYNKHTRLCLEKFGYLVYMKTNRYKMFHNYDDLNQEGFEALLNAMTTFNPKKGSFFAWAHHYVGTRISRSANLHTAIRFPLKVARAITPHKEYIMPIMIEEKCIPDLEVEDIQSANAINNVITVLPDDQREIIAMMYGLEGQLPTSINKICKKMNISRVICLRTIELALATMKEHIKL